MKLFPKGQGTLIKILSLTIGLTIGLVLLAKVQLERNFDACIKEKENVYKVIEHFCRQGEEPVEYGQTPGGVIPKMCEYIPEIVAGTRYTSQAANENITLENGDKVHFNRAILADSCFFDIFNSSILLGNERETLATKGQCLISRRMYDILGKDIVGKIFTFAFAPQKSIQICGVFDTFEENTTMSDVDIIMSLSTISYFAYDGTDNILGNDRYSSFVRLRADADMEKVKEEYRKMMKECMPWDELEAAGYTESDYNLVSVVGLHMEDTTVKTTCTILLIVALVMLFTAVMNYILVVISSLVSRARQVAVRKCIGAPTREFYITTIGEAATHFAMALVLMAIIIYAGQDSLRNLLGVSVSTLFSLQTIFVIVSVCLIVLLNCGMLPAYIYSRIPPSYAYRAFSESKRAWKLSLLAFQFLLSAMLLSVLFVITRQYNHLLNKDMGYEYKNVAYIPVTLNGDEVYSFTREIEKLPVVESASCAYSLLCYNQNGDNVQVPGNPRDLFNCADLFFAEPSFIETMGLKLVRGKGFTTLNHAGWMPEAIVDEKFALKMKEILGIDDILGTEVMNSSFQSSPLTIVGIVKDFTIGTLVNPDTRPMMIINGNRMANDILVKFFELTPENILKVQALCNKLYPDSEFMVNAYANELMDSYVETLRIRNLTSIGCVAALFIMLIGLIGYVRDEIQRRSRELTIRKVMGASIKELQELFLSHIACIALPSIGLGIGLGYYFSTLFMEQFPNKIALDWWIFGLSALIILVLTAVVVVIQTYRISTKNPMESIRTE